MNEIQELLRNGRKIEAIKRYREIFGASLTEAKEAVDALDSSIKLQNQQDDAQKQERYEELYQQSAYDSYEDMLDPDHGKKRKKHALPGRAKGRINYPVVILIAIIIVASYFGLLAFTKRYEANLAEQQRRGQEQSEVRL